MKNQQVGVRESRIGDTNTRKLGTHPVLLTLKGKNALINLCRQETDVAPANDEQAGFSQRNRLFHGAQHAEQACPGAPWCLLDEICSILTWRSMLVQASHCACLLLAVCTHRARYCPLLGMACLIAGTDSCRLKSCASHSDDEGGGVLEQHKALGAGARAAGAMCLFPALLHSHRSSAPVHHTMMEECVESVS
eukprot:scaffold138095_cov20-Tisochrysis_lutea.AAC.5